MRPYNYNSENLSATKVSKHTAYGYSTTTIYTLDNGKISMINIEVKIALKKVCTNIWEHAININK